ncbi:zf-HC2 domain-containing protein [Nocardioides flavescens]|uniref:Anti-sigma factor n=1 Tax=Nocardioides flavescens TaxID=2691959 RepID=A0A6L7F4N5_9ACTN|nr:anti-sigma factor [Nocardioides flavescens]
MTAPASCPFAHDDGAYVLGALAPDERLAFERHLADCDGCARSVRELAGLPGLLARTPVETVEAAQAAAGTPAPETLMPALVRRTRRSRRRTYVAAGLVAAALLVAGTAVGTEVLSRDPAPVAAPAPTRTVQLQPVGDEPIAASVALTSVGWGTRLDVTCRYEQAQGAGGDRPHSYAMFVTRADGTTEQVASWRGVPGRTMRLAAATAASEADIVQVVVREADGTEVLRLRS